MAHGACHDQAREIEDRWIGSLGISSAIAAKSRDHRRKLLGVPIRISNLADRARRRSQMSGMGQDRRLRQRLSTAGLPSTAEEPLPCPSPPEVAETQNRKLEAVNRRRTETALYRADEP